MSLIISNNLNSLFVQTNLAANQNSLTNSMKQLSSGLRINSAADDAAGLAIATNLNAQSNGDTVAIQNANSASSLAQIADGALASMTNDLQTLNSLAVESANGTNSSTNRAALQTQAQALVADIQHIASTTNYNGVNLLNGAFKSQFQISAAAGDTVGLSVASVQTNTLGAGQGNGAAAQGVSTALTSGDLVINNTIVGNSIASSDTSSSGGTIAASAIAKVAAINAVSGQSGVTATADATVAQGASMTPGGGASFTGTITLNGIGITLTTVANSTSATRQAEVATINSYSGRTGVTATDTGSDTTGISLSAADGRNITLVAGAVGTTAALTGLGLAATSTTAVNTYGGYTLASTTGQPITVSSGTGTLSNSGLNAGTYQANTASVSSTAISGLSSASTQTVATGDIVINGVSIAATQSTSDSLSYAHNSASSIAIVAAINQVSAATGVTATVNANTIQGSGATATSGHTGTLVINGISTSQLTTTTSLSTNLANEANAINAISGQTGVTAVSTGTQINLSAADGRNISIAAGNSGDTLTQADVGLTTSNFVQGSLQTTAVTTVGTYTLSSASPISITSNTGANVTDAGLQAGSYGGTSSGQLLSNLNISTVAGANSAISAIQNALNQVNAVRTNIGAFENRMTATVSNLQSTQTNLTAAYTTITGADFAAQTADLSRAQVIQQAGIAVLSQANAQSQQVLSLLR